MLFNISLTTPKCQRFDKHCSQ